MALSVCAGSYRKVFKANAGDDSQVLGSSCRFYSDVALTSTGFLAGVALAVILSSVRHISDKVFLEAAKVSLAAEQAVTLDSTGTT